MMKFTRRIILSSMLWKFMERCSVQLTSFIVSIVLARLLTPNDYGIIALVLVFVNLANVIVEGGFNSSLIQKKHADLLDFSTVFYFSLGIAIILYVVLYLTAPLIANYYNNDELVCITKFLGIVLIFYAINSVQKAYLVRELKFKKMFIVSLGSVIISGLVGILMACKGFGVWALVVQIMLAQIITTILMWFTVRWHPMLAFSWKRFKNLFDFGWKIFVTSMMVSLFMNIRSLIIGKAYSAKALALFDRGKQFPAVIIENINSSIQSVIFPVLSSEQDNLSTVKSMVRRSIKISSFIIFPLVFGLIVIAPSLVLCLLTEKWMGTVPFIRIFCLAYMVMPMQIANLEAIKSLGYSGTTLKLEMMKKIIEVIILVMTIPIGVLAIAWGIVIYNCISLFINISPNKKHLNYGTIEQIRDILPNFTNSLLMAVIIYLLNLCNLSPFLLMSVQILFGIAVYLLINFISGNESFLYMKALIMPKLKNIRI